MREAIQPKMCNAVHPEYGPCNQFYLHGGYHYAANGWNCWANRKPHKRVGNVEVLKELYLNQYHSIIGGSELGGLLLNTIRGTTPRDRD